MSEKAIECVSQMVHGKPFAELNELEANVALRDAPYVDAAVAPLVELANYAGHRMTCRFMTSDQWHKCDCGYADAAKALEGWKK